MRPKQITFTVANTSTTGFASGLTGAGPFTTFTRTAPTDSLAHQVTLTSAANISAITLTILGTDADGHTQSEAVTGPNATTVTSTNYFKTITSITASSTLGANTMDVGWKDTVASAAIPLDWRSDMAATINVVVTGTINFTVQEVFTDVLGTAVGTASTTVWNSITALAAKTSTTTSSATLGSKAVRVITSSYSSGATLNTFIIQATRTAGD